MHNIVAKSERFIILNNFSFVDAAFWWDVVIALTVLSFRNTLIGKMNSSRVTTCTHAKDAPAIKSGWKSSIPIP